MCAPMLIRFDGKDRPYEIHDIRGLLSALTEMSKEDREMFLRCLDEGATRHRVMQQRIHRISDMCQRAKESLPA